MQLTISIPTYDRNETLRDNLQHLLPQLDEYAGRVRLSILDNASPTPVEETLRSLLEQYPRVPVEIVRHPANIGANGNILRCFERCETPYLWTLSDDDTPKPDALQTIFASIAERPNCLFFNFGVEHNRPRTATKVTQGPIQFVSAIDSFGNTIFISTNVYKMSAMLPQLKFGYHFMYSAVTQFIVVLKALDEAKAGECCFSHQPIVTFRRAEKGQQWSRVVLSLGVRTLLEMPLRPGTRRALRHVLDDFDEELAPLHSILYQLLLMARSGEELRHVLYLYDQLCYRRYYGAPPKRRAQVFAQRQLLRFYRASYPIIAVVYQRRMKAASGTDKLDPVVERL